MKRSILSGMPVDFRPWAPNSQKRPPLRLNYTCASKCSATQDCLHTVMSPYCMSSCTCDATFQKCNDSTHRNSPGCANTAKLWLVFLGCFVDFSDQILFVDSKDNMEQVEERLAFFSFSPSETITSANLLFADTVIALWQKVMFMAMWSSIHEAEYLSRHGLAKLQRHLDAQV